MPGELEPEVDSEFLSFDDGQCVTAVTDRLGLSILMYILDLLSPQVELVRLFRAPIILIQ